MHEPRRRLDYTDPSEKAQADDYGNEVADRDTGKRGYTLAENAMSNVEMAEFSKRKRQEERQQQLQNEEPQA